LFARFWDGQRGFAGQQSERERPDVLCASDDKEQEFAAHVLADPDQAESLTASNVLSGAILLYSSAIGPPSVLQSLHSPADSLQVQQRLSKLASLDRWGFNGDNVAIWPRSTHVCCSASHLTPCQTPSLGISYLGSIKLVSIRLLATAEGKPMPHIISIFSRPPMP
jgi:hypothetical protein